MVNYEIHSNLLRSKDRCKNFRRRILEISQQVSALHLGGAFSSIEIIDCIYFCLMEKKSKFEFNDLFIISKGHGCMSQYVVLEELGILSKKDLDLYCKKEGRLGCHPDRGNPGIEASTGSLGHGIGLAVGMAYAEKYINRLKKNIYVVISDGELQEGSSWEAMMMAANLNVSNLVVLLDHNGYQSFGKTSETHHAFYPIKSKVEAFGWEVSEVNGHISEDIYRAVKERKAKAPFFLICNTVKGRGVTFMENEPIWHYRSPSPQEFNAALLEIMES